MFCLINTQRILKVVCPVLIIFFSSCFGNDHQIHKIDLAKTHGVQVANTDKEDIKQIRKIDPADVILKRPQVPVFCFHHIKDKQANWGEMMKTYSVTPAQFAELLQAIHDSGYHTILPNQLYNYLAYGDPLPSKPIMLTFDDTDEEQFTIGAKEMDKYGFKGVFFIMTVSIGKPHYMTKEQIKTLVQNGHAVESHTWNHKNVKKYESSDFQIQLIKPKKTIEEITGKAASYFAYPFGEWNQAAISLLKKADFKLAFALSGRRDSSDPLYTVRRMIVPSFWSTKGVMQAMKHTFSKN